MFGSNKNMTMDFIFRILLVLVLVALGVFFGLDTAKQPKRFISLAGLFANILFCWIFSKHRRKVSYVLLLVFPLCYVFLYTNIIFAKYL